MGSPPRFQLLKASLFAAAPAPTLGSKACLLRPGQCPPVSETLGSRPLSSWCAPGGLDDLEESGLPLPTPCPRHVAERELGECRLRL